MGAHFERGLILFELKRYRDAVDAFSNELELQPESTHAHVMRASSFLNLGRTSQAESDLAAAISIDPEFSYSFFLLSYVKANQRQPNGALRAIHQALRLEPDARYFGRLAELYLWLGRHEPCLKAIDHAIAGDPWNPSFFKLKAEALAKAGRRREAAELLRQALSMEVQDAETHQALGQLSMHDGQTSQALEFLKEARRLNPVAHNDCDAIAAAYGKLSLPFRTLESIGVRYQYWPSTLRWLLITTFCLVAILTIPLELPAPVVALVYLLAVNAAVFPFTYEFAAVEIGRIKYSHDFGLRRTQLIPAYVRFAMTLGLHALVSSAAIATINHPPFAIFLLTVTPMLELVTRTMKESQATVTDTQSGCVMVFMVTVPAFLAGLVFEITQSLPGPLLCCGFSWTVSYLIAAYL